MRASGNQRPFVRRPIEVESQRITRRRPRSALSPEFAMHDRSLRCSRRKFLASAAALTLSGGMPSSNGAAADGKAPPGGFRTWPGKPSSEGRKPIAVITTVYRPLSHAYHIAGRFIDGY